MLLANQLNNLGDIQGVMYDFEKSGDILPKHIHDENTVHVTIVARGKVKVYSHDWSKEAIAGQLLDFRPNEPHEIMALEDNTRIFNILKKFGGVSNDYVTVEN
jgi:quercetin dioxygenase-like cupin family protein